MAAEQQYLQQESHARRMSLEDVCPVLSAATKATLNAAEVGLFFTSPLFGPEVAIPAIVGVSAAKAVTQDLPRFDILTAQLVDGRYAEAFDGTLHYSRRIADSCLQQRAPQVVVRVAREITDLTHGWIGSLLDLKAR